MSIRRRLRDLFEINIGQTRILPMEGMRGFSALIVFFVHFQQLFEPRMAGNAAVDGLFRFLGALGHSGVDVFFALSGYIIYGLLISKNTPYPVFVWRRLIRLYPAFFFIFSIYVLMNAATHVKPMGDTVLEVAGYLLANFLMLPGIFHIDPLIQVAWSLSYELCFYLLFPLFVRWIRLSTWSNSRRICLTLGLCGAHLALTGIHWSGHPRLIMFGCGVLVRQTAGYRFPWMRAGNIIAGLAFVGALCFNGLSSNPVWNNSSGPVLRSFAFHLAVLFVATYALTYFALSDSGLLARIFSWDWIRWFGNFSYSYYLTHAFVLHFVRAGIDRLVPAGPLPIVAIVAILLTGLISTTVGGALVFLGVEKRFSFRRKTVLPKYEPLPVEAVAGESAGQ